MTLNDQNNAIIGFSVKIPWKKTHVPSFICLSYKFILLDFEIDLSTLKMTLNKQKKIRNEVLFLLLGSFVENSFLTL